MSSINVIVMIVIFQIDKGVKMAKYTIKYQHEPEHIHPYYALAVHGWSVTAIASSPVSYEDAKERLLEKLRARNIGIVPEAEEVEI